MPDFDDPFKSPDATVLRPRPGAGKRGAGDPAPRPTSMPNQAEALPAAAQEMLGAGLNPLVRAASPLLLLAGQLRGTLAGPDIPTLRRHALDEIRRFEDRARAGGVQNEVVLAARYALCAGLDEAVLSTPWGAQSEWTQQTLLVALHREAWGGEKFFEMLDRTSQDPKRHIDLMELQYLCLAFGFAGKYQVADRGQSRLSDVQHDLYRRIRDYRGAPPTGLSLRWKGLEDRRNPLIRYVPWWVVGAAALVVLAVAYTAFYFLLAAASTPVGDALDTLRSKQAVQALPIEGPRLRSFLQAEEQRRIVSVTESANETRVTLIGREPFASGSAQLDAAEIPTLQAIGAALNKVPSGIVQVVGHTDDQPVRSFRFANNDELSRARAESVVGILRQYVDHPGRLQAIGKANREPLCQTTDAACRARNRRIEVVHLGGS